MSCLSRMTPCIIFRDFLFQDTYFPVLFVCFPFFFFPSIVWNSSFGCVTDFYSNRQGLSSNSDCSIEQYKTHQCCSAVSPPMLLDKVSLEKLLSGYAGLLLCFQTGSAVPTSLAKQLEYSTLATSWNEHMPVTYPLINICTSCLLDDISSPFFKDWNKSLEQQQRKITSQVSDKTIFEL